MGSKMKGYALLIGVDSVNSGATEHYVLPMHLPEVANDIRVMYDILSEIGIYDPADIDVLTGATLSVPELQNKKTLEPTARNFLDIIDNKYLEISRNEDAFLTIFYTGHGASLEKSKRQFLCFKDRMLLENEMRMHLVKIESRLKVFFVVNACYSGGLSSERLNLGWKHLFNFYTEETPVISPFEEEEIFVQAEITGKLIELRRFLGRRQFYRQLELLQGIGLTFARHHYYQKEIASFDKPYLDFATDFGFLFSCALDQETETAQYPTLPTYFLNILKTVWQKCHDHNLTYREFEKLLKTASKGYIQPEIDTFPKNKLGIFDNSYPFFYTERPDLAHIKTLNLNNMTTINLTPLNGENPPNVHIAVIGEKFKIIEELSTTYDLSVDSGKKRVKDILNLLSDGEKDGIQYLGVIEVQEVSDDGEVEFPSTVPKMKIVNWPDSDVDENGNGFVVLYDTDNNEIKGKKRTSGVVSNKLGGAVNK